MGTHQGIVELKQRNPRFGCRRIAQQIAKLFGIDIDKDVVRRILATHYRPGPGDGGPSWLTFVEHAKGSLWSIDLFRCESILLNTHWVLVVMDQFTRRIIGFGVHAGDAHGIALCRIFNTAISTQGIPVPPLAGESSYSECQRDQIRSLRTVVASLCRAADRNYSPRVS